MSDAILQATIKAYDEFTQQFQKLQSELKRTDQEQKKTAQGADQLNRSTASFFQTIGQLGALYAFQQGLREVLATGREFELAIKQAQAVTGDMTSALRDSAVATRDSIHGPQQMADAFYSLGSAGLSALKTIETAPVILDFATAGLIDMESAAYATISTVKAFRLEWEQATEVTDAFTQAMNSTTLNAPDFQWVMASAGAVAKMASQDFREVLAAAAAMKDAGVQAQDAGTSIKSALMHMMDPAPEAKKILKELDIQIYDTSGQMKQWHEIVAEFERALAPYNEQSRNMILTTVLGTDGIRAMATGLNMGSKTLKGYVDEMKAADGTTKKMAGTMSDTFDGALRKVNADLERSKILLFEDFSQGTVNLLQVINTLLVGFNSMDESTRRLIERMIGGAGLVVAISAVASAMRALGITVAMITGPIGLTVMAITALTGAALLYKGHQEEVNQKIRDSVKENYSQAKSIETLLAKYEQLSSKTNLTESEQDQLKKTIKNLTDAVPSAVTGFDAMGNAITNIAIASEKARQKIYELRQEATKNAELNASIARAQLPELQRKAEESQKKRDDVQSDLSLGWYESVLVRTNQGKWLLSGIKNEKWIAYEAGQEAAKVREAYDSAYKELVQAQAAIKLAEDLKAGKSPDRSNEGKRSTTTTSTLGGTKVFDLPDSSKSKNPALDAVKKYVETLTAVLYPYKTATESAANAVASLGAKEQYLAQVMQSGQGTMYQAVELNKVRAEQLAALSDQQEKQHRQADAERLLLAALQERYKAATDPDTAKELRQEIENLIRSTAQLGQAWWQAEQQKLALSEQVRQEEKRRYDDAYQQAMDLMRHQVTMALMSVDQQIEYLQKLRDAHQWTQQQMWSIEEDLFRLRKQQLSSYLSGLEDEYKSKLDAIDEKTKASIKTIQDQIDALEGEGKAASREEAVRKHNDKLKDLQDKRKYHELRTGTEHAKAIADIDKEMAEEQRQFELQQQDWVRDDKKDALRKQIDDARKAGDEERKQLEDHYRRARKIAEGGIMDVIASLAATGPEWLQTGKDLIDQLIAGLQSGDFSGVESKISQIKGQVPASSATPNVPGSTGGSSKPPSQMNWQELLVYFKTHVSEALTEIARAGAVYTAKLAAGNIEGARAAHKWADQIRKAIGQPMVWDSNTEPDSSVHNSYAKGGPILYDQIAKLHAGEYVLPANLVDAIRRSTVPPATMGGSGGNTSAIDRAVDRIVAAIESRMGVKIENLLKIDNFNNEDGTDVDILTGDIRRAVFTLAGGK